MAKYKLAIFDWDGTILDSIDTIVNSVHGAAHDLNLSILDNQTVKNIIGLRLDTAIRQLYPELSSTELTLFLEKYTKHFHSLEKTAITLYPNVLETLHKLRESNVLLAVATGKSRVGLNRILNMLGMTDFFDATRCADETAGKPDPKMLNELLNQFNLSNKEAVMIGDASFDLQMAHNAGMDCIAVSYGAQTTQVLNTYSPMHIISQFDALIHGLITP